MDQETAKKILQETEVGYDLIASKFSETRKHFWRGLEFIGDYAKIGDKILDFGCGNGRLLELFANKKINYYGTDISEKLIQLAKQKYVDAHFTKTNPSQTSLAFANEFFNTTYSIAVFHHFPSEEYRKKIAQELYRVTKKDGYIIITVWNLWQGRYIKNVLKNWKNKIFDKSDLDWNDCYISFTDNGGNKFQRFHHAFTKRELKNIFSEAGFRVEKCKIINRKNILLVAKKKG